MREKRIRWNVFAQAVYTIALPIAFQNLLSTTASMVDTIMIGSMGELSVAAVGICSQISSLFFSCYFGFAGGALLFFSQYWGAKSEKGINKTFGLSMSFMLLVGLLFGAVAVTKPEFLLGIYTDKKNIIEVAIPYIRIVGFAYPLQVFAVLISFLMRSTERACSAKRRPSPSPRETTRSFSFLSPSANSRRSSRSTALFQRSTKPSNTAGIPLPSIRPENSCQTFFSRWEK